MTVVQMRHGLLHRMPGAQLRRLQCPGQIGRIQGLAHRFTAMPIHDADLFAAKGACRVEHMGQHGFTSEGLQYLGQDRAHALSLSGGENDDLHKTSIQ